MHAVCTHGCKAPWRLKAGLGLPTFRSTACLMCGAVSCGLSQARALRLSQAGASLPPGGCGCGGTVIHCLRAIGQRCTDTMACGHYGVTDGMVDCWHVQGRLAMLPPGIFVKDSDLRSMPRHGYPAALTHAHVSRACCTPARRLMASVCACMLAADCMKPNSRRALPLSRYRCVYHASMPAAGRCELSLPTAPVAQSAGDSACTIWIWIWIQPLHNHGPCMMHGHKQQLAGDIA